MAKAFGGWEPFTPTDLFLCSCLCRNLANMGIVGTLPAKLRWLNALTSLNLQGNK
jgi:hypothetical protein